MTAPDVLAELKYIAESPALKYGGFHEQTVATAKRAIEEITHLRETLQRIASGPSTFTPFSEMPRIAKYALPLVAPNR